MRRSGLPLIPLAVLVACVPVAGVSSPPTSIPPTASAAASVTATIAPPTSVASPTASRDPAPASPSGAPTSAPGTPTKAEYCAVDDRLTPHRAYTDTVRTYLDWTYALPAEYVPPDLVNAVSGAPAQPSARAIEAVGAAEVLARRGDPSYSTLLADAPGAAVRRIVYEDLAALRAAAREAGRPVVMLSAYRSYELQRITFDHWVRVGGYEQALRTSARPGHSEHQLGTVLDFGDGTAAPWEYADWVTTPTGAWLAANAAGYGFVMSYPRGKSEVTCYDYEPWHYRWVGRPLARQLADARIALREYQANTPR